MRRTYTQAERDELIWGVTRRGESVPEAAGKLGVSVSTAHRWVRAASARRGDRLAEGASTGATRVPTFVELVPTTVGDGALMLRVGEVEIEVRAGFDAVLLRSVVGALQGGEA